MVSKSAILYAIQVWPTRLPDTLVIETTLIQKIYSKLLKNIIPDSPCYPQIRDVKAHQRSIQLRKFL